MDVLLAYMWFERNHITETDGEDGRREYASSTVIVADVPVLALKVHHGLEVAHEVDVETTAVRVNGGVVMGVSRFDRVVVVGGPVTCEEVSIGVITAKDIPLHTNADKIRVFIDKRPIGKVGAGFDGRSDRPMKVTGKIRAKECAAVAVVRVGRATGIDRVGVEITAESC